VDNKTQNTGNLAAKIQDFYLAICLSRARFMSVFVYTFAASGTASICAFLNPGFPELSGMKPG
jgi:hypothetical protein